jgi:hypothetical protein
MAVAFGAHPLGNTGQVRYERGVNGTSARLKIDIFDILKPIHIINQ